MQLRYVFRKQVSRVDLQKDGTTSIGIVLKDGVKTGSRPVIKSIKKGSIAYRSHCVSEKDVIVSVCGQDARGMSRRDFKHLLREAESKIELELEYQIQEACLNKCGVYRMERIVLKLKKESESYGFVLRKQGFAYPVSQGYPVISYIKEKGPADKDGRLIAGDRLLQIDDQNLEALSLSQVADILQSKDEATFTIEYKIALIENSQIRVGERTNLEIDCPDADLGLVLSSSGSRMIIEEIRKGSLADRCGAFRIGDDILAINDIDVIFLSTSKANNLLRSFKKGPGRLDLVANTERLTRPLQNSYLTRENIKPLFKEMSSQLTPERDQRVPSNDDLRVPDNSPQSLFNGNLGNRCHSYSKCNYYRFQLKTIVMLREIIENITNLETFIPSLTRNNIIGPVNNSDIVESNRDQIIQCGKLPHLKILSTRIKNSAHSMAVHLVKNGGIASNRHAENGARSNDCFRDNPQHLNQDNITQELMKNLVEIYTKKLISKHNLEKLQLKINKINSNCWKCNESCMLAALTTQQILLIASLNSKTKDICFLITKLIDDIFGILLCEDCRVCTGSQTGFEISRTIHHFRSSNPLNTKPSSLAHSLKGKTPLGWTDQTRSNMSKTTGVNTLGHLYTKPFNSTTSLLSSQTEFESPTSVDSYSKNVSISNISSREAISDLNCKTNVNNPTQTSGNEKQYPREIKAADNGSLCFAMGLQPQNRSEEKAIHNSSLGFATPTLSRCMTNYDREGPSGNSTPQTPNDTQNNSFSYQAELLPCKDNADYGQRRNCTNYSSNIQMKILREKGLLKPQPKNCRSEQVAESEGELLKYSKPKIQKHSSEPQFLSTRCQSSGDNVPNLVEKEEHLYANVEILDGERKMSDEDIGVNRYWSPFHRSDFGDHPNILDIPNWSAKSSHSLKQIDHFSDQRIMQDTVDVTLKNEGKGYGLSVEFLGSPSEDSIQVPRITAVSSQGAAHKIGILLKGDRVLTINGKNTTGMTATDFEHVKEEAFSADEVLLTIEFDVVVKDLEFGTFDVCVTKTSKTGLIYNDFQKGSPLVVKGIVKGSPAHRCGSLLPGDEVLYANNIRQEFYDVSKNTYERSEFVIIKVRRQLSEEKIGEEINLDQAEFSPLKTYDLNRTSIHSNHDSNNMFLEQELTLYRDPVAKDFGFLIGRDQVSKTIYVTGIRPEGPADCSKVIKKNDIILQVNGVDLEANKDVSVVSLFHPTVDRLELKTRRILKYE